MNSSRPSVVVIGASNLDIGGVSLAPLVDRDSNPGIIKICGGGVGHNIAMNLALMAAPVRFLTAFGDDSMSTILIRELSGLMDLSLSVQPKGHRSSTYMYVADSNGDMKLAINDMELVETITPEVIRDRKEEINEAELVIVDANLSCETIEEIGRVCTRPVYADGVSTIKINKLRPLIPSLAGMKFNKLELATFSGIDVNDRTSFEAACSSLRAQGVKSLMVTFGAKGSVYYDGSQMFRCHAHQDLAVKSTTGAGDCFLAGYILGVLDRKTKRECMQYAAKASEIASVSAETINRDINRSVVRDGIKEIRIDEQLSGLFDRS